MTSEPAIPPLSDPGGVIDAWSDLVLFADLSGMVRAVQGQPLAYLPDSARVGLPFWRALGLKVRSLEEALVRYPVLTIHDVACAGGRNFLLRVIPLAVEVARPGGFVIVATDNRPMENLCQTFEERLEDNISALSDSIALFNALFDTAKDPTILADTSGVVLSANVAAGARLGQPAPDLAGCDVDSLLAPGSRRTVRQAMDSLGRGGVWTGRVEGADGSGGEYPAEATVRRIRLTGYSLFQLILHDLSRQAELRADLRDQKAEVEKMNIALMRVIKTVEEDRREMRQALTSQVRQQMLPALERIAKAEAADVREGYRAVIEERLADLAGDQGSPGPDMVQDAALYRLSPREMEVCQLIQLGRTGAEIAGLLNLSFETIQTHRKNIRRKLGLRGSRTSLYAYLRHKPPLS
ncbi:PAS domain S-box protein [Pseudodesulfovibrio sp. F-1]|uniref:PAS domain S-box protein n=1 Tax=Pseudodesulfovibrio alkaliphilus TaxID=2661613 RepID=A0A7K1KRK0_9BACT|nr:LuxR family transcriptional regulator [Pseudodesulfovibrio alkaliphilus]MUM78552.1 PAS domain S-box protein [Pseudodesulfovibrio alkaliphilus]